MSNTGTQRELTEQDRLVRIAEMFGAMAARVSFDKPLPGARNLAPRTLFERRIAMLPAQERTSWIRDYDFVTKPFTLHLLRFETKADSKDTLTDCGQWRIVQEGTQENGVKAYKLQLDAEMEYRRVGWFDEEIKQNALRAVVVIRWAERLIEIRAPYHLAKELTEILQEKLKLREAYLVQFTPTEHGMLLDRLNADYTSITVEAQGQDVSQVTVKSAPDRRMGRRRAISLQLGADGNRPACHIPDTSLTRESGWVYATIGTVSVTAQIHRRRGTFHTKDLLRERDIDHLVVDIKAVKGY